MNFEGVSALVTPSIEPGLIEVFALAGGRLVAHKGFEPLDAAGLALFAEEVLTGHDAAVSPGGEGADEARVVAAYLKRHRADVEAVRLSSPADLVDAARRLAEGDLEHEDMIK
jgi:hypothetical protein